MSGCATIDWTRGHSQPAPLDRVAPGESDWFEGEISGDIDCDGSGVIISSATPTIRTEDDDGLLAFGVVTYTGTEFRIPYTVDPTQTQHIYTITVTVVTSDARTLKFTHTLPVVPTTPLHA